MCAVPTFPSRMLIHRLKQEKNYVYALLYTKRKTVINKDYSWENAHMKTEHNHINVFRKPCYFFLKINADCDWFLPISLPPNLCELTPHINGLISLFPPLTLCFIKSSLTVILLICNLNQINLQLEFGHLCHSRPKKFYWILKPVF